MPDWFQQLFSHPLLRRQLLVRLLGWTLVVAVFVGVGFHYSAKEARQVALARARDNFRKDLTLRNWVTERGGVYVRLDAKTPANPFLAGLPDRAITSTDGRTFTMVNAAYLNRMLHDQARSEFGMQSHLTSLDPIRPQNLADAWERKALKVFESGPTEYWEEVTAAGRPLLRFMGALRTEESCLPCHAHQGHKLGDVRGGISISIPMAEQASLFQDRHSLSTTLGMAVIWSLGLGTILLAARADARRLAAQQETELNLLETNQSLENRVREEVAKNKEQERILEQQARSEDMGAMISAIAHQWRQPLNSLGIILANLKDAGRFGELTPEYLEDKAAKGERLIQKMSTTINDFMDFFRAERTAEVFSVRRQTEEAISLVEASFGNSQIALLLEGDEDASIQGFPGEFSQVLLNLLNNAREAVLTRPGTAGAVRVSIQAEAGVCRLSVSDTGGGIQVQPIERIFDPYITTKPQGTGLGLYMSRRILERSLGGRLEARNIPGGAKFTIIMPIAEGPLDATRS